MIVESDTQVLQKLCQLWQYQSPGQSEFNDHADMVCIAYNYYFMKFEQDPSQFLFTQDKFVVNFKDMTETVGCKVRSIKKATDTHLRLRKKDSERFKAISSDNDKKNGRNFDKNSFSWLSENYIRIYGLRNWTWKAIIEGIKSQHILEIKSNPDDNNIDVKFAQVIWSIIVKFGGVIDLNKIPNLSDPESPDVKLILTMYSFDSFLYKRLNESDRLQKTQSIKNLGPFAVGLTKIIDTIQCKRKDNTQGEITCYSGLALHRNQIEKWK